MTRMVFGTQVLLLFRDDVYQLISLEESQSFVRDASNLDSRNEDNDT